MGYPPHSYLPGGGHTSPMQKPAFRWVEIRLDLLCGPQGRGVSEVMLLYFIERIDSGRGCVTRLCGGVVWEGCVTSFVVGKSKKTQPQGRAAPLWSAAEGRAFAFSVKCGDPVAEDVHSAWNSAHFTYVWHGSVDHLYISSVSRVDTQFVTKDWTHLLSDKLGFEQIAK